MSIAVRWLREIALHTMNVDPTSDPLWRRLVEREESSVFNSPAWLRVLADTYDLDLQARVTLDPIGEPEAGLAYCQVADIIGERIVSLPFSDYCDPLVQSAEQWNALVDPLFARESPILIRPLHNSQPRADARLTLAKQAKWHGLDLRPGLDALWHGLDSTARRAIEKARREGVVTRVAQDKAELRAFFDMHFRLRKYKYRLLAQPYRFFENIWRHFIEPGHGLLLLAVHQDEIIGGIMFLQWKDRLYYKFNASSPSGLSVRPNDLMIWEGIRHANAQGCTALDFGLSDWDQDGLVRYKRKFATEEKTISFLRWLPPGGPTRQEQEIRALLGQLTELFTLNTVPDSVSDRAGELLYQYFT
ncbi:MAG TPA: GNAT family N-acetyltransferase [Ardenticatenaceae bacterium]|nr:GNAT family N-acetyltransferase [Ardenticatenaceae bacterium]